MAQIPLQRAINNRNPTLIPNFDKSVSISGSVGHQNPATFLANNPRVNATEVVTLGGTTTTGDTVALTFTNAILPNGPETVTYTVIAGDTVIADVAAGLASLINADANLQAFGVYATTVDAVMTINWPGPVGNFCALTSAVTGAATETVTKGNAGVFASGTGPIIATDNFEFAPTNSSQPSSYFYGQPYVLGYDVITQMVAQARPIA